MKFIANFPMFFFSGGGQFSLTFLAFSEKRIFRSQNWKIFMFSLECDAILFTPSPTNRQTLEKIENSPRETVGFYFNWKQFRLVFIMIRCMLVYDSLYFWTECFSLNVSCPKKSKPLLKKKECSNPFFMKLFVVYLL